MVARPQGRVECHRIAGVCADDGFVETVYEIGSAHFVGQVRRRTTLYLGSVDQRDDVDGDVVASLHWSLHPGERGKSLAQRIQLRVYFVVSHRHVVDCDRDSGEVGQGDLRPDVDLGCERQLLSVVQVGDLDVRLAQSADATLSDRVTVSLGQGRVDRLLEDGCSADTLIDDPGRSLPGPEARYPDLSADLLVGGVEARLELL